MPRYANNSGGGSLHDAPAGTHLARLVRIIDIGTQRDEFGDKQKIRNRTVFFWELPGEIVDTSAGPSPLIVTKFFTNSLHEKANLRADLSAWRGRDFTSDEAKSFVLVKRVDGQWEFRTVGGSHVGI